MKGSPRDLIVYLATQDDDKIYEVKEYKEKRSLNANNYAWKLITEIGNIMRLSKEQVYLNMLIDYGQSDTISVLSGIDINSYFKYNKKLGSSILNDKEFTHYRIYKGTSEYNTKEMAIFIDGVVEEAKQLGIEVRTPKELEELKRMWNNE